MRGERAAKQRSLAERAVRRRLVFRVRSACAPSVRSLRSPRLESEGVCRGKASGQASKVSGTSAVSGGGERASPTALVVSRIRVLRTRPHFNNSGRKRVRADTFCCIKVHGDGKVSNGRFRHSEIPNGLICN